MRNLLTARAPKTAARLAGAVPAPGSLALAVAAGLAFAFAAGLRPVPLAAAGGWLTGCGVLLAVTDVRTRRLPDPLTGASLGGLAVLLAWAAAASGQWHSLARAAAGAAAAGLLFLVLALARPGSAGLGDAKLALSTGGLAAWFSWGTLLASVMAAFVLAACCGVALIASRRATWHGSLPFGPFLLAGALALAVVSAHSGLAQP